MAKARCVNFPYTGIGTWAMKAFLEYLIKYKKGLSYEDRNTLLSKVEKSCTMECIENRTMRPKLLKGIAKVGGDNAQRYFDAYSKKHYERAMRRKSGNYVEKNKTKNEEFKRLQMSLF